MLERHLAGTRAIGAVMGTRERAEELAKLYERETNDTMRRIALAGGRKPKALVDHARDGKPFVIALCSIAGAGAPLAFGDAEHQESGQR